MKPVFVLIVDDEAPARNKLRAFLEQEERVASIIEAENTEMAVRSIVRDKPDLVLLDIQMPGGGGFDVIDHVGVDRMPPVIFVTAYDRYAIAAFDVEAVDYLLKPFDQQRFRRALNRALSRLDTTQADSDILARVLEEFRKGSRRSDRILVSEGDRHFFVKSGKILCIRSEDKYVRLHTEGGNHLVRSTLNKIEQRLNAGRFVRIHRTTLVNIDAIRELQPWSHGDLVAILTDGTRLNVSRRYRHNLLGRTN